VKTIPFGLFDQWAEAWLLEFNVVKCHAIHFDKMNSFYSYFFSGHPFSSANNEQDLEVTINN